MSAAALTAGVSYNYPPVGVSRLIRRDGVTPTMSPDRDRRTTSLGRQTNGTAGMYQQPKRWGASAAACRVSKPIRHKVADMEFTLWNTHVQQDRHHGAHRLEHPNN